MPDPTPNYEEYEEAIVLDRHMGTLVRVALLLIAVALVAVFAVAVHLDPYRGGKVWRDGTHQQLGLQPCTFKKFTGYPCPSCGMTSSFALLVRGDVWNSVQANGVGTLLALFCLLLIPWTAASAIRGETLLMRNAEGFFLRMLVFFLVLMLLRWAVVLGMRFV